MVGVLPTTQGLTHTVTAVCCAGHLDPPEGYIQYLNSELTVTTSSRGDSVASLNVSYFFFFFS